MTETTSIIIPDADTLTVDTSCIDVSEVESQEDKGFLMDQGEKILKVVARAALEVGRELVDIQERFRATDARGTGLVKFYESLGLTMSQVSRWTAKYKAFQAYVEIFGEVDCEAATKFNDMADRAASNLMALPTEYREAFFADIALGNVPSQDTVEEVCKRPEVKLSKAEELLEAAKVRQSKAEDRWEMLKADPEIKSSDPEYKSASTAFRQASKIIAKYEDQIKELEQRVLAEEMRNAEYEEREKRVKTELEKLKFDDEATRTERIKRLTNSLTISVPQVMADLQKFFAEKENYPEDVRAHLLEQSTYLANYIGDNL